MNDQLQRRLTDFMERRVPTRGTQTLPGIAVGSLQGPFRDDNQDRALVAEITTSSGLSALVGIVCDGLGGMEDGGRAASIASSVFLSEVTPKIQNLTEIDLEDALHKANEAVFEEFRGNGGTTLTAVISLASGADWIVHVGDSRAYLVKKNSAVTLLTRDDTVAGIAVNEKLDEDLLDNRLLQFVGIGDSIEPHIFSVRDAADKEFLLTTDGAHSIGGAIIRKITLSTESVANWVKRIVYVSDAVSVTDNATVVALSRQNHVPGPLFCEGTTLNIRTANDTLELWLQGEVHKKTAKRSRGSKPTSKGKGVGRSKTPLPKKEMKTSEVEAELPFSSDIEPSKEGGVPAKGGGNSSRKERSMQILNVEFREETDE